MKIALIRHGRTIGNVKGCFNGVTNDPLCQEGVEALNIYVGKNIYPNVEAVVSSPMTRCLQTANIIYPHNKPFIVDNLKELNFGDFENKTHLQLENNPDYIKWIKSNGTGDIPNGEGFKDFTDRCVKGFYEAVYTVKDCTSTAFITHGGVIMALLTAVTGENFYTTVPKNGLGFVINWENNSIVDLKTLE